MARHSPLLISFFLACTPSGSADHQRNSTVKGDGEGEPGPTPAGPSDTRSDSGTDTVDTEEPLPPCDTLEALATEYAKRHGEYVDCGAADLQSPGERWQAVHDCFELHHEQKRAFMAIFYPRGIDSIIGVAYIGIAAADFRVHEFRWDNSRSELPDGTWHGEIVAYMRPCKLEFASDCASGLALAFEPCIRCIGTWEKPLSLCKTEADNLWEK